VARTIRSALCLVALAVGVSGLAASLARGSTTAERCKSVQAAGGDYNGAGGTIYAALRITNTGKQPCTISGRPWIRLPRLDHPVTVTDLRDDPLAGRPGATVTLAHGQETKAFMLIKPGSCDRTNGTTFTLWARAGWANKGVTIVGTACDDGTAQIEVGSFQR
jgi:hypothetical protein